MIELWPLPWNLGNNTVELASSTAGISLLAHQRQHHQHSQFTSMIIPIRCVEINRVVGKSLTQGFFESLDHHSPRLLDIFKEKTGLAGQVLDDLIGQKNTSDVTELRFLVLRGLPVILGDDPSTFFKTCFDRDDHSYCDMQFWDTLPWTGKHHPTYIGLSPQHNLGGHHLRRKCHHGCWEPASGHVQYLRTDLRTASKLPKVDEEHVWFYPAGTSEPW